MAIESLERYGFILKEVNTCGETSGHMWCVGFDKSYSSVQQFLEHAHEDYAQEAAKAAKGGGANLEWESTYFHLVNPDKVRIRIFIPEDDGDIAPVSAKWAAIFPGEMSEEKKEQTLKEIRHLLEG